MGNNQTIDEIITYDTVKAFAKQFTDSREQVSDPIESDMLKTIEKLTVFLSLKNNRSFSIMDTVDFLYNISCGQFTREQW